MDLLNVSAQKHLTVPEFPANVAKLDNGLTVIHQAIPATPVAVVDVWVRAGAIAEPLEWLGMAHFLEHMIFKGTHRIPPGLFDQVIEARGGMTNAATSHDYAHYFIVTSADHLSETLPYLAEILLNARIPDDEFDRERNVVLEEIRQAYDDPDWIGLQTLNEMVYQRHPYGRPVLGTESILHQRSPEEMRCFHQTHYQPENMTVVVVGGVEWSTALELVTQAFSTFADRQSCPLNSIEAEPPITEIRRKTIRLPRLEQARLLMAWQGPGVDQIQNAYGLDLLSVLLADGRSSRLVRDLREQRQLVQDIGSCFSLQRDSSLFTISAWLEPEALDTVEAIICDHLAELATIPVSEGELNRGKRLLCNDYAFSTETSGQLAGLYGYYSTIAQPELSVTYPYQIQAFQPQGLQQLANHYLSPQHYVSTVLQPL